jgi:hypothetical protein
LGTRPVFVSLLASVGLGKGHLQGITAKEIQQTCNAAPKPSAPTEGTVGSILNVLEAGRYPVTAQGHQISGVVLTSSRQAFHCTESMR